MATEDPNAKPKPDKFGWHGDEIEITEADVPPPEGGPNAPKAG